MDGQNGSQDNSSLLPIEKKRFIINENGSDRLKNFRTLLKEEIQAHPEIVGATIFGSNIVGRSRERSDTDIGSDIDTYIFVDAARVGFTPASEAKAAQMSRREDPNLTQVQETLQQPIRARIQEGLGLESEQMRDVRVEIISQERIEAELNAYTNYYRQLEEYQSNPDLAYPDFPTTNFNFTKLFHLQIGRELDPYRSYILHRLQSLGTDGERMWKLGVNASLRGMERDKIPYRKLSEGVQKPELYPQTVSDALTYFHLENIPPQYPISDRPIATATNIIHSFPRE